MSNPGDAQLLAENATLRAEIKMLTGIIGSLKEQIEELTQHKHVLRLKVDALARKLFGKSSEKLDPAQLQMVFDALQNETPGDDAAKKPPPPIRPLAARRLNRHRRPQRRATAGKGSVRSMNSSRGCR